MWTQSHLPPIASDQAFIGISLICRALLGDVRVVIEQIHAMIFWITYRVSGGLRRIYGHVLRGKLLAWFWLMCVILFFSTGKMKLNMLARPLHWGLLLLCIVSLCSPLVSTGNRSSRGQTGRCQTQPDHLHTLWDSLWLLTPGHQCGWLVKSSI